MGCCNDCLTCDIAFNAVMPLSRASTRGSYSRIEGVTVLLTNEGPSMDKRDDQLRKIKHGDDGMCKGNKTGVSSDDFRTLKPP